MRTLLKLVFILLCAASCAAQTITGGTFQVTGGGGITFSGNGGLGPDNLYCGSSGGSDGPAALPLTYFCTALANTPATGATVNVSTAGQLTTALAAATCGQKITLQAGVVFSGNFVYPALACPSNNYVYLQTSAVASLPPEGTRSSPAFSGVTSLPGRPAYLQPAIPGTYTAQIITPNASPALRFTAGASGVRIIGIEFARTPGTGFVTSIISAGNIANLSNIIQDRVWCHGTENLDETESCIDVSGVSNFAAIDSYINNIVCYTGAGHVSCDSHGILGGLNTANVAAETGYKLLNTFIEAAGENVFFGGGGANTTPADIEIRLNAFFKPQTWNAHDASFNGGPPSGGQAVVKNLFELKNAQRVLVEGNTFTNNWGGFSQNGSAILLTPKNGTNNCTICMDANLTVRYNIITSTGSPFQIVFTNSDPGFYAAGLNHVSVHDVVSDNIDPLNCFGCSGAPPPTFQVWSAINTPSAIQVEHDVTIRNVTAVYASTSAAPSGAVGLSGPAMSTGFNMFNMTLINNVMLAGVNGAVNEIIASCASGLIGTPAFNACWANYSIGGNCFITNGANTWPSNAGPNITSLANQTAAYVNYNNGNGGDYTLSANACHLQGLDGLDPGANIAKVASVIAGNHP